MKTILYIDGFNFYYSAVKGTPHKWLNPVELISRAFPRNTIIATKYFSARVSAMPNDPQQPMRQSIYWRALQTLPNSEIILGEFRTRTTRAPVVTPPPKTIEIYKTEEKGSDVNLGAHLLMDGFQNKYEAAIVVTGDSDLITPIRMARQQLRKTVGILNPQRLSGPGHRKLRSSAGLKNVASFYQNGITWAQLQSAQFAAVMEDKDGVFHKPASW
jgi:uncharacterized LabA/DUF88 family protein